MSDSSEPSLYVGALITSLIGAVLLLATDFAGWYNVTGSTREYGWISVDATVASAALLILVGLGLLYCAYISFLALQSTTDRPTTDELRLGLLIAKIVFFIVIWGGIIFSIAMMVDDPSDWWLDTGFYAGALGSLLTFLLFNIAYKERLAPPQE